MHKKFKRTEWHLSFFGIYRSREDKLQGGETGVRNTS